MNVPHECPLPLGQACPQAPVISTLQSNVGLILDMLHEQRDDIKEIKKSVAAIALLEQAHGTQKEALDRAFKAIHEITKDVEEHEKELNHFRGMKMLAIAAWAVLSGGVGAVLLKLFGGHP